MAHEAHIEDPAGEVDLAWLQVVAAGLAEAGLGIKGRLVHQRAEPQVHVAQSPAAPQPQQALQERF